MFLKDYTTDVGDQEREMRRNRTAEGLNLC